MEKQQSNISLKGSIKQKTQQNKLTPSQLVQKQISGNFLEDFHQKPKIVKFLNLADYSIYTDTNVPVDEPLFEAIPPLIQFTDYEPLQLKEKVFKLRNKDKVARRVKILQPDSRLFQVMPAPLTVQGRRPSKSAKPSRENNQPDQNYSGNKVAPGMEAQFFIKFSPEAKIDYNYDLVVVTEREQFIVPIIAIGKRAMIDFPDTLDFGNCPVKYITEKPIIIRNLGEKTSKWFLKLPQGFDADKKEGVLEYGVNEQIVVKFFPNEAKSYKSEAVLQYDKLEAYVPIMGIAHNSNVYLSKSYIQMDDAYIGLQTQQTLQIINKSEVKVDFEWRAFSTEKEEQEKKNRLRQQLEEEEAEERMLLKEIVNNEAIHEEYEIEDHDDSDEEDKDEKAVLLKRQRKAELMLARKYKNIRKAIEDDLLLFQDDIFSIEPQQGQIWPNSEMTITITFVPKGALHYSCVAYCNISCSEERLALNLGGEGIGPKAFLSQNDLPIGNKNVNEKDTYTITIENRGEIECKFELLPNERNFGKMFKFAITKGNLGVGKRIEIPIEFCSTIPGEFKETFRWRLEGSTELLSLTCFGHVTAPKFKFDVDQINFGKVSYSFAVERKILLINQSNVAFTYNLRIPGDGKSQNREFDIDPARDVIKKDDQKEILITFIPRSTKVYQMVMVVDIEGVGQDIQTIPIKAESEVPKVQISPQETLDFGDIFLRNADTRKITITNNSLLKAKFQIIPQNEESKILATYRVDIEQDTIEPGREATIKVTLMTMKLREITLPLSINIVGANNGQPYVINIIANSIGPRVEVCNNVKELDFGTVEVLKDYSQKITIKNNSRIVADFHTFTKNKNSIFKPIEKKGVLQPDESKDIEIICCCDEATKFQDILHFVIKEGMDIDIVLKAKGTGSTVFCKEDLTVINFGVQYTQREITREIFVENKGRKDQKLTWQRKKPVDKKKIEEDKSKKVPNPNSKDQQQEPVEEPDVFTIKPESIVLPHKHGIMFQFRANSTKKGKLQEIFQLNCAGVQERKTAILFNTTVEGDFIQPTLIFSERKLYFKYVWEKNVPFMPISKNLDLTCGSQLPVNFSLKVAPPFSINNDSFSLLPGKQAQLRVDFDPGQKVDRVSGEQLGKIQIIHQDHPYREFVDLVGEVCFPNIKLEQSLINFGSILNDTSKKMIINMENVFTMPIYYEWTFVEEELAQKNYYQQDNENKSQSSIKSQNQKVSFPINEVFDILPLSGNLGVGESDQVEFVYNAFGGQRFKTTALCHVEGGPNYEVTLIGDSSLITYKISQNQIELGEVRFCDWISREFFIENTGKVTFEYKMIYTAIKRKGYIECTPSSGKIIGGEKQKISIRICPVMPNEFKEIIQVQIGYFEPEPITITGKGFYPAILINIPRGQDNYFQQKFQEEFEKRKLERENTLKRQQLIAKAQAQMGEKTNQVGAGVKSLEQIISEVEKELDRIQFCNFISKLIDEREKEKLLTIDRLENYSRDGGDDSRKQLQSDKKLPDVQITRAMTAQSKQNQGIETRLYEKINLSTYVCDFGNVVINNLRKLQFKIQNVGTTAIDLQFDTKQCRNQGYTIMPERTSKLMPGDEQVINVSYQAKKRYGQIQTLLPLEIKNGAKYLIQLLANITIPDLIIENLKDVVDFGKVLCSQRKTIYLRFINEKEIDCEWSINQRQEMLVDKKKEPPKFALEPLNGIIQSGQKQVIQISFFPQFEKEYTHRFVIQIDQNPKPFIIQVKGFGTSVNLQLEPTHCQIGPVLPYDKFSYCVLEIKNPSEYSTELYSLDFDRQYLEEENILNDFEEFDVQPNVYVPIREPGKPLWDFIKKDVDKKRQRDAIFKQLENSEVNQISEQQKELLQRQLIDLQHTEKRVEFPQKVEDNVKHHLIVYGPTGVGKTFMVESLQKQHRRQIINLADIVDWNIDNNTPAGRQAKEFLDKNELQKQEIISEREKLKKKAGKKAQELEEKWGPIKNELFTYLTEEILESCIKERIESPDCNAGIMVDGLTSKYFSNQLMGLKVLLRAIGEQSVQFVMFKPSYDDHGYIIWKIIEWDGMKPKEEDAQLQQAQLEEQKINDQVKKKKSGNTIKDAKNKENKDSKKKKKEGDRNSQKSISQAQTNKKPQGSRTGGVDEEQNEDEVPADNQIPLFEIYRPCLYESQEEFEQQVKIMDDLQRLILNQYSHKIEHPKIYDLVFEEGKKEEKKQPEKKKEGKGGKQQVVEVVEVIEEKKVEEVIDYTELLHKGPRIFTEMPLHYNLEQLAKYALEVVPAPIYPDPNLLPVQEPIYHYILNRPSTIIQRKPANPDNLTLKYFQILTPIDNMYAPDELSQQQLQEQQLQQQQLLQQQQDEQNIQQDLQLQQNQKEEEVKDAKKEKKLIRSHKQSQSQQIQKLKVSISEPIKVDDQQQEQLQQLQAQKQPKYQFKLEQLQSDKTRWIIPSKKTLLLVVKFFTKVVGDFDGNFDFECFSSLKKYQVDLKGISDYPTISQLPKNLYWSVKKNRPPAPPESYLSKIFVSSEGMFDFGPLLVGKNPEKRNDPDIKRINSSTFRISNQGKFDCKLEFALMSSVIENNPEYKKGIYWIEQDRLDIPRNDVPKEIRVWAIPDEDKKFKDDLIIMIKDNPIPVIIPMQALGAKPIIKIIEGEPVRFDRLLLKQQSKKQIILKNEGFIPCKWKLTGLETLPQSEFKFENVFGELKPTEQTIVEIEFKAIKQQKYRHQITLEVEDTENMGIKQENKIIPIEAEAFDITVDIKFPDNNNDNILTFGAVRVGDIKDAYFSVKNIGLYLVKLSFAMKKKLFKDNFKIEPQSLELDPNQEKQIQVRFCSDKEVKLKTSRDTTDIIMEILEGKSQELFKPVPINIDVNSQFSKYSIVPLKNMNFGPIQFNDQKVLSFEIKNEGMFDFNYNVFDFFNEEFRKQLLEQYEQEKQARLQAALAEQQPGQKDNKKGKKDDKQKDVKKAAKKGKEVDPQSMLRVGQWAINPSFGQINPQGSQLIEITFAGAGMKLYEQKLAIEISGRNPVDYPKGILYEVIGESCIPGIICDNFEQIFEEQIIVPSSVNSQNITSIISSNVFYYEEKCFNFGTIVPSKNPEGMGICEKFKIINPGKIPCTVKFDVRKRNPQSNDNFAFQIATQSAKIHPHESTYVKVYFKPTIMAQYSGIFEALVEQGEQNPKTYKLVFDLRGEGAMPTLKLEKPKEYFNDQTPMLKFQKVRIEKSNILPIVLKNEGYVPATVKWDLTTNENFRFLDHNSLTLNPKTYSTFNIEFKPVSPGIKQWTIAYQTLLNPYEITKMLITGEGFYEDIVFENLPNESEDEVNLGDCIIGQEKPITFAVKNNSNEVIKFNWNTQGSEDFTLIPRVGHIKGKSSKTITLIFKSMKSILHKNFALLLETKQIKQFNTEYRDWDDSMYNVRYVTPTEFKWWQRKKEEEDQKRRDEEAALAELSKKGKGAKKQDKKGKKEEIKDDKPPQPEQGEEPNVQLQEPVNEPDNGPIDKTEKNVSLKVTALSDFARYDVNTKEIYFKETLMYTSRTHQFTVKNTSLIKLKYKCRIILYDDNIPRVDPGYFYISPKEGVISANCDEYFTVRFSPTEVHQDNERFLLITIENQDPNSEPLVLELNGETERPICHFELPPSNYREKKQDIDTSFNILEFDSLGTKVKNTKRFYVVNPTATGYEFEWKKIEEEKLPPTVNNQFEGFFKCLTQKGVIMSGKKFEMIFEYIPDQDGTHEAYYSFEIPDRKIIQNFMLVGNVNEPNILFDVGKVSFGPLLIGGKNKEVVRLKNLEDVPINFHFDKSSVQGEQDFGNSLVVHPMSGTVRPNYDQLVEITFQPQIEREYNYNLLCSLTRKSRPVSLNIKGIGYILDHNVYLGQQTTNPIVQEIPQLLQFGDIYINEKRSRFIIIENKGEFNFDFNLKRIGQISFLQIVPENGTVKKHEKFQIELKFIPVNFENDITKKEHYKFSPKHQLILSITSGPNYIFNLQGSARQPGVQLSFLNYDFGPCFVLRQPLSITAHLEMRNRDNAAMSIETLYEKKNYLDVQLAPGTVIMPLQLEATKDKRGLVQTKELNVLKIPISFTPRECIKYDQIVTFDINALHKIDVRITGEGIPFKLELEKAEDQNQDFGIVRVNKESSKYVSIINYSKKPLNITFDTEEQLAQLKKYFISVIPSTEITINPKERKEIEINFAPKVRLHQFKKELFFKIIENKETRKLLNISANCHGIELKLIEDTIGFGAVTINSKKIRSLQLANLGDIGARYEWDTTFCSKFFTITPQKGFLPPNEDTYFQITFHPNVIDNDINFKNVRCNIQGSDPLLINLLGKCVDQPKEQIQDIKFETMVRTEKTQKVSVKNPSSELCKIKVSINTTLPKFQGYFQGKETLEINPNGQADYEIVYKPLTMTTHPDVQTITETAHEGTLFFPLPDGSALLYNLTGVATPPTAEQTIDTVVKAKHSHIVTIAIKNWLKVLQRFNISWKTEQQDQSLFISGAKTFDVGSDSAKDYKLSIYGLKQTNNIISVYFTNEQSNEFKFFKIKLTVQPPDILPKIELTSIVRETIQKIINIENPLDIPIEIKKEMLTADNENISFNPNRFTIPAHSEFGFEVVYRPLLVKEENSKIQLKSPDLGDFIFPLSLKGIASSQVQRTMTFKSALGSDISQTFKFLNYCRKPTTYTCRVDKIGPNGKPIQTGPIDPKAKNAPLVQVDFQVETPSINVQPNDQPEGNEVSINLRYEPSILGESSAILVIQSPEGGEYQCNLHGISSAPQPKGPFKMVGPKPAPIEFKNPFFEPMEFIIRLDNTAFSTTVKSPVKIDGKKGLSIAVVYKAIQGQSNNGRLTISIDKSDYPPWVFYIQGE